MKYPLYQTKTVYPEDIQCVWEPKNGKGGIYIGNLEASQNLATLKKHGIKAVLTAAKDINLKHPKSQIPYHLHVPGEDHQRFDLTKYFDRSIDFISDSLQETNILVHCMAGISRSVTLVLAYLMKHQKMTYDQAFNTVRRKRKIINPNRGFIRQLQQYERILENQKQAMRRSHDNFQSNALQNSMRRAVKQEPDARQALHLSMKRNTDYSYTDSSSKRYSTIGMNEQNQAENPHRHAFNSKYQIPTRHSKNQASNFGSYHDLNRQLDEKIASIRKKYMQATDLLNRQDKKKASRYNPRGYFNDLQKTDLGRNFEDNDLGNMPYPQLTKTISANQPRNMRSTSYANYSNPRKVQGYMYYNY